MLFAAGYSSSGSGSEILLSMEMWFAGFKLPRPWPGDIAVGVKVYGGGGGTLACQLH